MRRRRTGDRSRKTRDGGRIDGGALALALAFQRLLFSGSERAACKQAHFKNSLHNLCINIHTRVFVYIYIYIYIYTCIRINIQAHARAMERWTTRPLQQQQQLHASGLNI